MLEMIDERDMWVTRMTKRIVKYKQGSKRRSKTGFLKQDWYSFFQTQIDELTDSIRQTTRRIAIAEGHYAISPVGIRQVNG